MSGEKQTFKELELLNLDPVQPGKDTEQLLNESMTVVKEVREELAKAYKENKDYQVTIEGFSKSIEELKRVSDNDKKTIEMLSKELDVYKTRDAEATRIAYNKRLESLSNNFKSLGQDKTTEQLSKLPVEAISELEVITNLALRKKSDETLSSVTIPTQAMSSRKVIPTKKPEQLSNTDFMKGLCQTLQNAQNTSGTQKSRMIKL